MSPEESIEQIMREAGPLLGLDFIAAYPGRHAWQLCFDAETSLDADYDAQLNRLVISGRIAEAPEAGRLSIYTNLLRYNAGWTHSGGARMALEGDSDCVQILFDLPCAELQPGVLAQVMDNLVGIQRGWRQILLAPQAPI